ncbi:MAG: helix-turn-helix domain-containing protein [Balneolaceae bacterium]
MEELKYISNLLEGYKSKLTKPGTEWPHDIRRGLNCLNEHLFDTRCSVRKMKITCNIAGQNFSSRFRNYTGFTPRSYISYHRLKAAKILLNDEKLNRVPVNSLGFMIGYEKPSAFNTRFKKKTNLSPTEWRKNGVKK